MTGFATLQRLARKPDPEERCELCGAGLRRRHEHLIDPVKRKLLCACGACSILFFQEGETKYKRIPGDMRMLHDFSLTEGQWDSLMIPIGLAFFFHSSVDGRVLAMYPSPAGPTESMLPLECWQDIVSANPVLGQMRQDVEALLVNRLGDPPEYYLAPVDRCYVLVGLIRSNWRGLSGGTEVWERIRQFFQELKDGSHA